MPFNRRRSPVLPTAALCALLLLFVRGAGAQSPWVEGQHYFAVPGAEAPAGAVTVTEVFSYGCPACNAFQPYLRALRARVPAGVGFEFVPASWIAQEDWPVFQRAFLAARTLGVAERAHEAMFAAIWETGELATFDRAEQKPKSPLPSIEDVARFYERVTGVPAARFAEAARAGATEAAMRHADEQVKAWQAERTPTLIIDGRWRVDPTSAGGGARMVELASWLVERAQALRQAGSAR